MAELSSCYFCGAALDTALERHSVATTGGETTTVVLCPTCRRKLVAVLDRTLDADPAAESDSLLGAARDGDGPATGDAGETAGDEAPPVADVTPDQGSTDPDPSAVVDEGDEDDEVEAAGGPTGATTVGGTGDPIFGTDESDDDTDERAPFGNETPATGESGAGETAGEAATAVRDAESAAETETPVRDADSDRTESEDAGTAAESAGSDDVATAQSSGSDTGGAPTPPDAETYNRVVRLLQNREFPVQTAEIEEVALNAYDIAPDDFRAVIDTAVDRGVLAEDGGQLTLPD